MMRYPIAVQLRPSRAVVTSVFAAHLAAALAFFHVLAARGAAFQMGPLALPPLALLLPGIVLLGVSLVSGLRGETGKRALCFVLAEDGSVTCDLPGRAGRYRVAGGAVDFGWAVWLSMSREEEPGASEPQGRAGRGRRWAMMLVRGNAQAEGWRGLRTWLRHKAYRA